MEDRANNGITLEDDRTETSMEELISLEEPLLMDKQQTPNLLMEPGSALCMAPSYATPQTIGVIKSDQKKNTN